MVIHLPIHMDSKQVAMLANEVNALCVRKPSCYVFVTPSSVQTLDSWTLQPGGPGLSRKGQEGAGGDRGARGKLTTISFVVSCSHWAMLQG